MGFAAFANQRHLFTLWNEPASTMWREPLGITILVGFLHNTHWHVRNMVRYTPDGTTMSILFMIYIFVLILIVVYARYSFLIINYFTMTPLRIQRVLLDYPRRFRRPGFVHNP
jgi:hypothetical protein